MSNPQINILKAQGSLTQVQNDILEILKRYATTADPLCSHEILGLANSETIIAIGQGITPGIGGFSIPSSWIGSVAADITNNGKISETSKLCKFNKHVDEAWHLY